MAQLTEESLKRHKLTDSLTELLEKYNWLRISNEFGYDTKDELDAGCALQDKLRDKIRKALDL